MEDRERDARIRYAVEHTQVFRPPRQTLATFGATVLRYHLVSQPVYADLDFAGQKEETVVRDGVVRADRPQVVTPFYLARLEGFSESASRYLQNLIREYGPHAPGLLYSYKNEPSGTSIVSGSVNEVANRIRESLDREESPLESVILGVDELWDVSVMKFIFELTNASARSNFSELQSMGLLETRNGVPEDARRRIEWMLEQARNGNLDPSVLHRELERWNLFEEYQDRFLGLFRKH
ncbi:MAG: hypothetical protein HY678_12360 [Chloroflexi bacterium]|nr:hypothetical protein [Chloroflexota bacterium]